MWLIVHALMSRSKGWKLAGVCLIQNLPVSYFENAIFGYMAMFRFVVIKIHTIVKTPP